MCFRVHDDLRLVIDHGKAVVTLDDAARRSHLRALGIGEIGLLLIAGGAALLVTDAKKRRKLIDLATVALELLGVFLRHLALAIVELLMLEDNAFSNTFELLT